MPLTRQAKILSSAQQQVALDAASRHRYPERDRAALLLSFKAGLRAKEIAAAKWSMVLSSDGSLDTALRLTNGASKGRRGGREIPLERSLKEALQALHDSTALPPLPDEPIIRSERGAATASAKAPQRGAGPGHLSAGAVTVWFHRLYKRLGFQGASSHSGRRTFGTQAARKIVQAGGSLKDVQELLGHANLGTTQRYIDANPEAKRRVVEMI